ncbi:AI-2E family transporter [Mycetocola reblochoni]|uniref:AI-2E family transporter n=1 Tax=Mycetocola reblochoni TaxID=331618 RepID=A0A3L6ZTK0_9MICO|nr:AI-2E family transporter [Mycetocola reblochoni]
MLAPKAAPAEPDTSRSQEYFENRVAQHVSLRPFRTGLLGAIGVLVALALGGLITQLSTVLVYIGLALFLALGLDPLVTWLERRMKRGLAIVVVAFGVLLLVAGILLAVIPVLVEQTSRLISSFPEIADNIVHSPVVAWAQEQLGGTVDIDQAIAEGVKFLQDPNNLVAVGGGVAAVGAGVASGFTGALIVTILTLYFLASLRSMKAVLFRLIPAYERESFAHVTESITGAVGRYVVGQVSLAAINGVLTLILMTVIGGPVPYLLAFVAFFGSMIPLVGTLSASVIIALSCLVSSPQTALIAAIYYLVYMQIEAYVLSPRIMSKAVAVPGAIVVIAAVAGGAIGGILGALVAIPVAASVIIIIQKVVFPLQDSKTVDPNPTILDRMSGDGEQAAREVDALAGRSPQKDVAAPAPEATDGEGQTAEGDEQGR